MEARQGMLLPALHSAISMERMSRFQQQPGDTSLDMIACYMWNMALGEALYPTMQTLEVALRNNLHAAATVHFGTDMWFEIHRGHIDPHDHDTVHKTIMSVRPNVTSGRVIHAFSFGFWTTLMNRRYEKKLLRPILKATFPAMPNHMRNRPVLSQRFNQIRELRNRVFHHERIWDWRWNGLDLVQQHRDIIEAIGWISPAVRDTIVLFDRFPVVYAAGATPFKTRLEAYELTLPR